MKAPTTTARRAALAIAGTLALTMAALVPTVAGAAEEDGGLAGSDLWLNPYSTTLEAAQSLSGQARADAQLLGSIPSADWITTGTPAEAQAAVDAIVDAASARHEMPVIVAYDLPYRDCAQYSAGGALNPADYKAWIDGVAAGIGGRDATVILEPDGLGIIPWNTDINGNLEWCQPEGLDASAVGERYTQLNYAVDALKSGAGTSVYLDGTGPSWLGVGDTADRLVKGGVEDADGFFLNASNYQFTTNATYYGTWVSSCIALGVAAFKDGCGNQYWSGGPANGWVGVALSTYGEWSSDAADPALNTSGIDSRYQSALDEKGAEPTTHFVIDTSRNGQGPWDYPDGVYTAHEDWCNPPDRGTGVLPSTETGNDLVDAHLWIKVPGESDGKCYRGTPGPLDPERGIEDPAAGQWFVEQARELIANSNPPLAPLDCNVAVTATKTGKGFVTGLAVQNTGAESVTPWTLSWTYRGDQVVDSVAGGSFTQIGADVSIASSRPDAKAGQGKNPTLTVKGTGSAAIPWLFSLNGKACTSG
jgi:endoglucanase